MTRENKIEAITQDIREKLPRMMQLEEGCLVEITDYGDSCMKIIGKEPEFNDIMDWIYRTQCERGDFYTVVFGNGFFYRYANYEEEPHLIHDNCPWDLSKPRLIDQTDETINYLYKFLTTDI